ncbi:hypothetical protein EII06_28560, partial [Klebsiella pneumoniae]
SDVLAAYHGDPAARSVDEVLLCYPGIHALIHHRLAHQLYLLDLPLLARIAAEIAHGETGIDIHPGAQIGPGCFIDHGTGVVIGETARIGRGVRIYQAVTLGAKRFTTDADGNRLQLHTLSPPRRPRASVYQEDNDDFAAGYINYFVINGAVIAPEFGDARADGKARDLLRALYPGRDVVQLDIDAIASGGGGIHCVTHQLPAV